MEAAELLQKLLEAVLQRDPIAYADLYEPDAVSEGPRFPGPVRGRDAIAAAEAALFQAFSEIQMGNIRVVAEGPRAAAELVLSATNTGPIDLGGGNEVPATGRRVEVPGAVFIEVGEGGLIRSERVHLDTASLMRQLGLLDD